MNQSSPPKKKQVTIQEKEDSEEKENPKSLEKRKPGPKAAKLKVNIAAKAKSPVKNEP